MQKKNKIRVQIYYFIWCFRNEGIKKKKKGKGKGKGKKGEKNDRNAARSQIKLP